MADNIFRKKSIENVTSPEQLNDYIRVTNPGVWKVVLSVVVFLAGVMIWGIFGHLDTRLDVAGTCRDGQLICYVKEEDASSVAEGMPVSVEGKEYRIAQMESEPIAVTEELGEYLLHLGELEIGEWVYPILIPTGLEDGSYRAAITTERVSPIYFIVN